MLSAAHVFVEMPEEGEDQLELLDAVFILQRNGLKKFKAQFKPVGKVSDWLQLYEGYEPAKKPSATSGRDFALVKIKLYRIQENINKL